MNLSNFILIQLNHLKEDIDNTVEIVSKVRERIGESIGLMLDVHMGFDTFNAIKLGKELEKFVPNNFTKFFTLP